MSIWGTLSGVVTGIATGNPATGVAVGTAVNAATDGSTSGCPRPVGDYQWLFQVISPADRQAWIDFVIPIDTGAGVLGSQTWSKAIRNSDASALAYEVSGGEDCRCSSEGCKRLVAFAETLLSRYRSMTSQGSVPTYTPTQPSTRDQLTQIGNTLVDTASAVVQGGLTGAQTAADAAATGATRTVNQQQRLAGIDPLWLLAGGAVVFAVYAASKGG